jgi:hypothetical protein
MLDLLVSASATSSLPLSGVFAHDVTTHVTTVFI